MTCAVLLLDFYSSTISLIDHFPTDSREDIYCGLFITTVFRITNICY